MLIEWKPLLLQKEPTLGEKMDCNMLGTETNDKKCIVLEKASTTYSRVYPLNFNMFSMTSPWPKLKIKDLLHALWHERYMYWGHELRSRPQAPADFAFEDHSQGSTGTHSTERCWRHQNLIWLHKRILVLKCWMKKRNNAISWKDAF